MAFDLWSCYAAYPEKASRFGIEKWTQFDSSSYLKKALLSRRSRFEVMTSPLPWMMRILLHLYSNHTELSLYTH